MFGSNGNFGVISWFECLPIEIQERILYALSGESLLTASKVCTLWCHLAGRVARERYKREIPVECISEIGEEVGRNREAIWLKALNYHYRQKFLLHNLFDTWIKCSVFRNPSAQTCFTVHGSLFILGNKSGSVEVFDAETGEEPVVSLNCGGTAIRQIQVAVLLNKIIIISNELEFYTIPNTKEKNCKMKQCEFRFENYPGSLPSVDSISIQGFLLAVVTNPSEISVFRMGMSSEGWIEMTFLKYFETKQSIQQISLWNNTLIGLLRTGEVMQWCLTTSKVSKSERYQEIRYQNPLWIFRGRIFCSTIISCKLLGLWHMESGTSYWLVGKPNSDLVRCRDLGNLPNNSVEEVLSVYLKQRLLFCGTKGGKILIYYLSDAFFDAAMKEANANENIKTEFDRAPDFIVEPSKNPIQDLKADFTDNKIYIVTWSNLAAGATRMGCIQSIVLSENLGGSPEDLHLNLEVNVER